MPSNENRRERGGVQEAGSKTRMVNPISKVVEVAYPFPKGGEGLSLGHSRPTSEKGSNGMLRSSPLSGHPHSLPYAECPASR
jgi:hypothetical protein